MILSVILYVHADLDPVATAKGFHEPPLEQSAGRIRATWRALAHAALQMYK